MNRLLTPYSWKIPSCVDKEQERHIKIRAGAYHTFFIDERGRLFAWGLNHYGQLGLEALNNDDDPDYIHEPRHIMSLEDEVVTDIWGGEDHSVACTQDGRLYAWGRLRFHAVGIDPNDPNHPIATEENEEGELILRVPTEFPPSKYTLVLSVMSKADRRTVVDEEDTLDTFQRVACGLRHSVGLTTDGRVFTWGTSDRYQTGLGRTDPAAEPTMLKGEDINTTFVKVDAGEAWSVFAARPQDAE